MWIYAATQLNSENYLIINVQIKTGRFTSLHSLSTLTSPIYKTWEHLSMMMNNNEEGGGSDAKKLKMDTSANVGILFKYTS